MKDAADDIKAWVMNAEFNGREVSVVKFNLEPCAHVVNFTMEEVVDIIKKNGVDMKEWRQLNELLNG